MLSPFSYLVKFQGSYPYLIFILFNLGQNYTRFKFLESEHLHVVLEPVF